MLNNEIQYNVYGVEDTKTIEDLNKKFLKFADGYDLTQWTIPALIKKEVLEKCGYFSTMPNQLTGAAHFKKNDDFDNSTDMQKSYVFEDDYYFTPAACIHFYPELEKLDLKNKIITTLARVYRYEDGKFNKGVRCWEFLVREFVAVGEEEFVKNFLEDFKSKAVNCALQYSDKVKCEAANDIFFPSQENNLKQRLQKMNGLKFELLGEINGKHEAIGSFNYHGNHFSKPFNFDKDGTIVTGCAGFGIDRWISYVNSNS
jgi:seryl-tRNA synthetase